MDKLAQLKLKRILNEYELAKTEEEYTKELIEAHKQTFLNEINKALGQDRPETDPEPQKPTERTPEYDLSQFHLSTAEKMKKAYRGIVKLTHPDKVKSERLNSLYIEAKDAYWNNNVMEIFLIAMDLNVSLELADEDMETMSKIVETKIKSSKSLESSYVWLWIKAQSPEEKQQVVESFIKTTYGK